MLADERNGVLVVGGGIGGLSLALVLRRLGVAVTVLEQSPDQAPVGGAIQIWVNGMRHLADLGLAERVREVSAPLELQSFRSWKRGVMWENPVGEFVRRYGLPAPAMIRRGDLFGILAGALPAGVIEYGAACTGFEQDEKGVTAILADGREVRGSVLVAADGLYSTVRRSIVDSAEPRYAGYQYLRGLASLDGFPPGLFSFTFGVGDRFGVHDLGSGAVYWFGVIVADEGTGDAPGGRKAELLERFRDFPAPTLALIESTPDADILRTDTRDLDPLDRWIEGRVVLLGDAAHATTPNLGRGGGEALEDAVFLGHRLAESGSLEEGDSVAAALTSYEAQRRPSTRLLQERSRRLGAMASVRNRAAHGVLELAFKQVLGKRMTRAMEADLAALQAEPEGPASPERPA